MSQGRVFPTIREALHATATGAPQPMKALAGELDWSPSELSMRTTLGGESTRAFPADDEHLVKLMRVTGDYSVLFTLADLCGYELRPKEQRTAEIITEAKAEVASALRKIQMAFELDDKRTKVRGR